MIITNDQLYPKVLLREVDSGSSYFALLFFAYRVTTCCLIPPSFEEDVLLATLRMIVTGPELVPLVVFFPQIFALLCHTKLLHDEPVNEDWLIRFTT